MRLTVVFFNFTKNWCLVNKGTSSSRVQSIVGYTGAQSGQAKLKSAKNKAAWLKQEQPHIVYFKGRRLEEEEWMTSVSVVHSSW